MYGVLFSDTARKDLDNLPQSYQRLIFNRLITLASDPRPRGSKKLEAQTYRVRQGPYRVLYEVHDYGREVLVLKIKARREGYR